MYLNTYLFNKNQILKCKLSLKCFVYRSSSLYNRKYLILDAIFSPPTISAFDYVSYMIWFYRRWERCGGDESCGVLLVTVQDAWISTSGVEWIERPPWYSVPSVQQSMTRISSTANRNWSSRLSTMFLFDLAGRWKSRPSKHLIGDNFLRIYTHKYFHSEFDCYFIRKWIF